MSNINPTPGRVIWFNAGEHDGINRVKGQPLAAIIAAVNADGTVNLAVFDAKGVSQPRLNVTIVAADADAAPDGYAEWMPYQLGQAAKTEAVVNAASNAGKGKAKSTTKE